MMMFVSCLRGLALGVVLVVLAACSSTATQTVGADSRDGSVQRVAGSIGFGSMFNPRYIGRWTLSDRFARSCTYRFLDEGMDGSSDIGRAVKSGYCTPPFDDVVGWRAIGRSVVLFNGEGRRLANLSRDGSGDFRGRFRSTRLSSDVVLRKVVL